MVAIYTKRTQSPCTVYQLGTNLKYMLYENEEDFRLVKIRIKDGDKVDKIWVDIPKKIAPDIGTVLQKHSNGLFNKNGP
jgi:hypothetical protein